MGKYITGIDMNWWYDRNETKHNNFLCVYFTVYTPNRIMVVYNSVSPIQQ